ncbi:hypothetical protein [Desulfosporosinus metallidurans]|uniref:Uncharacterized protein n=1 Tax=Desulfosporosinus metallidurans TaxID=1888891 RepID=A0A1Q8R054_9FIRM|nr:hypothetical protein [Desulfosporosinus metallidurans]OLN32770.1 hypothetical protein DSOL_1216 [Desulfosporosinus metallidurans]
MFMGSLMIISGCFLYWLLKPPVPHNSVLEEEIAVPRDPSLNVEGVAGCLISQPYSR